MELRASGNWWRKGFFDPKFYTPAGPAAVRRAGREAAFAARVLGLRRGAAVLDLCCGPGRHSIPLARRGFRVVGLDWSAPYVREARRRAAARKAPARFVQADMRDIGFEGEFDAVINLFTSFGYFTRQADNLKVLRGVARALKPGGLFLIETINRGWLLSEFRPRDWFRLPEVDGFQLEARRLLPGKRRIVASWLRIFPGGRLAERRLTHHLYDKRSLSALLRRAGLEPARLWGELGPVPLREKSRRLVILAIKR